MRTTIAQLTDLHIREPGRLAYGKLDTAPYLREAIASVQALPQAPDAVVVTGDLTDFGRPAEYAHLRQLLDTLTCPVFLLAGNHDDPAALRAAFPEHVHMGGSGDLCYSQRVGGIELVALDTTVRGQPHGALGPERLAWLAHALEAANDRPVLLAMHHPPFRTLIGHMDAIGLLQGAEELEALLRRHANVERVICGHLHRPISVRFGGTIASTCPAPAHQVVLDLQDDAASAWNLEPGAFQVHVWEPGTGLVTHQASVGRFPGPFPFHDGGVLID